MISEAWIQMFHDDVRLTEAAVPLDEAVGGLQAVLHRQQSGLQRRRRSHAGSLRPEAALSAHPPPPSGRQGGVTGLCAQSARLQQVRPVQHSAAAAPLVGLKQAAQALLQLRSLFLRGLLVRHTTTIIFSVQEFRLQNTPASDALT